MPEFADAERMPTHVAEIVTGAGDPPCIPLTRGQVLAPISVGSEAQWAIGGVGVLPVHAYLYFDGKRLYVQSANELRPAIAGGEVVPRAWLRIDPPCAIDMGVARVSYRAIRDPIDADDTTRRGAKGLLPLERPFAHGDLLPLPDDGPESERTPESPSDSRVTVPRRSAVPVAKNVLAKDASLAVAWGQLPMGRKVLYASLPVLAMIGVVSVIQGPENPPEQLLLRAAPAASDTVQSTSISRSRDASIRPSDSASTHGPIPLSALPHAPHVTDGRREREAADALAKGDNARAATLYEELAAADPYNPVYGEAARILRAKLDGGAR